MAKREEREREREKEIVFWKEIEDHLLEREKERDVLWGREDFSE